ncbi:MAG: hypothetical protein AB7R40_24880 [Nitrospiraceae bacterium]
MWQLLATNIEKGYNPDKADWKRLGEFPSVVLAARRIKEIEKFTADGIPLQGFFFTHFMDDEDAVLHYTFNSMTTRYLIRKKDPPPPQFRGSLGKKPPTD